MNIQAYKSQRRTPVSVELSAFQAVPCCVELYDSNSKQILPLEYSVTIELFHLPTLMQNSLFINNMYVTLLSSTCFEH